MCEPPVVSILVPGSSRWYQLDTQVDITLMCHHEPTFQQSRSMLDVFGVWHNGGMSSWPRHEYSERCSSDIRTWGDSVCDGCVNRVVVSAAPAGRNTITVHTPHTRLSRNGVLMGMVLVFSIVATIDKHRTICP